MKSSSILDRVVFWLIIVLLSVMLYLIIWIDCAWEQVLYVAEKYLLTSAAAGAVLFAYAMYDRKNKRSVYETAASLMISIAGGFMFTFSFVYILVISLNVFLPPQTESVYQAHVIAKKKTEGKDTRYYLILDGVDRYGFDLRFKVPRTEYQRYKVGDFYRRKMQVAGLGIEYRLEWQIAGIP